jgi:hypothetical protein
MVSSCHQPADGWLLLRSDERVFVVRLNLDALSNGKDSFQFSVPKWSAQT